MAEAGPSLVVPTLVLGGDCPLLGKIWLLPSRMESIRTGAASSALPPDHSKDAQDGRGDGALTLALWDVRAGLKEPFCKVPSPLL